MPALVFGPALGSGLLQFSLGDTTLAVLGREEHGSVLADDLRFSVAEEALGPSFQVLTRPSASVIKMA
jgi:hypothetical protein